MSHTFGGQTRWGVTRQGEIKTCTVLIIEIRGIPLSNAGCDRLFRVASKREYLKEFVVDLRNQDVGQGTQPRGNPFPPPLGVIKVIHTASRGTLMSEKKGVLTVVSAEGCPDEQSSEKKLKLTREPARYCCSKGKPTSGQVVFGGRR